MEEKFEIEWSEEKEKITIKSEELNEKKIEKILEKINKNLPEETEVEREDKIKLTEDKKEGMEFMIRFLLEKLLENNKELKEIKQKAEDEKIPDYIV